MFTRNDTRKIKIGNIYIGNGERIKIQSMCNKKTTDIKSVVSQILELEDAGVDIIRVSVPDVLSAESIESIKNKIHISLVADIHFDYRLALMCCDRGIDKIRINPGNIGDSDKVREVALSCKRKNIPIRIGVNSGSLSKDILKKFDGKVTAEGLFLSAVENVEALEKNNFFDIVVSIKSSNVNMAVSAYEMFASKYNYPIHLGITEAGTERSGIIKSSVGLGIMLNKGLGDTMRVSLTANPIEEVRVAKKILESLGLSDSGIEVISCPTCARTDIDVIKLANEVEDRVGQIKTNKKIKIAVMGCAVNGPGEARECDIGVAGGKGEGIIFIKGEIIKKVKEAEIVEILMKEVEKLIKTVQ